MLKCSLGELSIMKKIFTILFLMLFTAATIAAERPRWVGQPIYVYIPEYGNMSVLMKQAYTAWQNKSKNLVRFKFVNNPNNANIEVEFVDFVSHCNSADAVGCTEMSSRSGQYYKAYVTIGTKEYVRDVKNGNYSRKIVTRTKDHIYGVMLHEAGHSIGLDHSENKGSIMYPYDLNELQYLTNDDIALLYKKYH